MEQHHNPLKPRALSDREKYARFGQLTDHQRGALCTIITRSRAGQWTRYADIPDYIESPPARILEIADRQELGIVQRMTETRCGKTGKRITVAEFCVV